MKFRIFNICTYSLLACAIASVSLPVFGADEPSTELPSLSDTSSEKRMEFTDYLELAVNSADPNELRVIEDGLARLRELTVKEKEELRAFIVKIALREDRQIFKQQESFRRQKVSQELQRQMHDLFSVSPEMIKKARKRSLEVEKAMHEPLNDVKEIISTIEYDINSNEPIDIPLVSGMVNQVVFFDNTGTPWEITDQVGGDGFTIDVKTQNKNVVTINTDKLFSRTNAAIFLKGLNYSVPLSLKSNASVNTTRLTVRMKQRSPDTEIEYVSFERVKADDNVMDLIANGHTPKEAKPVVLDTIENTEAWLIGDHLYIRSQHKLRSPGPTDARVTKTSGVANVYKVAYTSTLVFSVDWQSKPVVVTVSDVVDRALRELIK